MLFCCPCRLYFRKTSCYRYHCSFLVLSFVKLYQTNLQLFERGFNFKSSFWWTGADYEQDDSWKVFYDAVLHNQWRWWTGSWKSLRSVIIFAMDWCETNQWWSTEHPVSVDKGYDVKVFRNILDIELPFDSIWNHINSSPIGWSFHMIESYGLSCVLRDGDIARWLQTSFTNDSDGPEACPKGAYKIVMKAKLKCLKMI